MPSEYSTASAFVPVDGLQRQAPATQADARAPFLFLYIPGRWAVQGGKVRPLLGTLKLAPGVNGVDQILNRVTGAVDRILSATARVNAQERGRQPIPVDAIPDEWADEDGVKSYLRRPEGRPDLTISMFEKVYPGSKQIDRDDARYFEWLDWLMESGNVPRCPEYMLNSLAAKLTEDVARLQDRLALQPSLAPTVESTKRDLTAVQAEIAARTASEPTGKRKRPAKTAAVTVEE
jgi:hypothetical protein